MTLLAGPGLDREVSRRVLGIDDPRVPPYSTENCAADVLLWRLSQRGVAFKVQELEGQHFCMLWNGAPRGLSTGRSPSRPLAICRAALELSDRTPAARTSAEETALA
jgi:hypothetical protein